MASGKMLPLIVLAGFGVFALCGAALAAVTIYRIREGVAAARWPTATAVVNSLVVKDEIGENGGISRHVEVAYTFTLNGVAYDGTRIHPIFVPFQATDCLTGLRDKLAIGKSVRVHYDPNNPANSMLATGFFSVSLVPLFGGLFFYACLRFNPLFALFGAPSFNRRRLFWVWLLGAGSVTQANSAMIRGEATPNRKEVSEPSLHYDF